MRTARHALKNRRYLVSETTPASTEEPSLPPGQITVSNQFAERIGPDGVQRWAAIIQSVAHDSEGWTPDKVEELLVERLDAEGLAGPPVEMRSLAEILAVHPNNEFAFVDGMNKPLFGPTPEPGFPAHLDPEAKARPRYS